MKKMYKLLYASLIGAISCTGGSKSPQPIDGFAKGADISWVTEMEAAGRKFYTPEGKEMECTALMKELGLDAIRLRVWVDPPGSDDKYCKGSWNNTADMLVKARRAKALGMRLMIDFHYSDCWADPAKQFKPAAWKNLGIEELKGAVAAHTTEVLTALKNENITPEWVQVGNETPDGMLWETGRASTNMANYAALNNAGYDAVKAVFPSAKVIVHVDNGYDNSRFRWLYDGLKKNGGKWDVIGMSLYPSYREGYPSVDYQKTVDECIKNANDMIVRYGTEVMICEVGMPWDKAEESKAFLTAIIEGTKNLPSGKGLGVFYWEPESAQRDGYMLGAFDNNGKPTVAMEAFR
jgi:arabinogalactan endo-1,4-beta-galactosidase